MCSSLGKIISPFLSYLLLPVVLFLGLRPQELSVVHVSMSINAVFLQATCQ